jgi:hypothetical protein
MFESEFAKSVVCLPFFSCFLAHQPLDSFNELSDYNIKQKGSSIHFFLVPKASQEPMKPFH